MRRMLIVMGVVALAAALVLTGDALAGKARTRQGGGTRDRIRECAEVCPCQAACPCADQQQDKDRDQQRDGNQIQDRDRDRICDCGNYIDMDGDGFCDNCTCPGAPQDGTGRQHRGGE